MKSELTQFQVSVENTDVVFETGEGDTFLGSMLRAGIGVPYECNAGGCGSCKFTLVEGTVSEDLEACAGLRQSDRRKNKHLACVTRAQSNCVISIKLDDAYIPQVLPTGKTANFISRVSLTHDLWEFRFQTRDPASFLPGQYAKLHIPGVSGPRSYSMANTANNNGLWIFQIKRVHDGEATTVLFNDDLEEKVFTIDAPYSIAHLDANSTNDVVCIAGGSGLAPMVSILCGVAELHGKADRAVLYYGARSRKDVVDPNYFSSIPGFDPHTQYVPVLSEPEPGSDASGPTGFIHEHLGVALPEDCSGLDFYLAGPPPMVDAVRRHLILDRQIPIEQLHYDRFF